MTNKITTVFDTETYLDCQVCHKRVKQISIMETFDELLKNRKSFRIKKMVLQKINKPLEKFKDRPWNDY